MSLTQKEVNQMWTDVEMLKLSTSQVLNAIGESVAAQKENSELINALVIKMTERDVHDEYREKELDELKDYISRVDDDFKTYREDHHDSLEKLSQSQKNKARFYNGVFKGVTSTWGKFFAMILIAACAYVSGIDLTKFIK